MPTAPYAARRLLVLLAGGSRRSPRSTPDQRAQTLLVDTDNAVRTSAEELALARDEFGERAIESFAIAVDKARTALASAFEIRQRLDDGYPETSAQRRDMHAEIIALCGRADQELEAHADAFVRLRNLAFDRGERVERLTRQAATAAARLPVSEKTLSGLATDFPAESLTTITDNVAMAGERVVFAEQSLDKGRAIDAIRSAESAIEQAHVLLDSVDRAADDIRHAIATLPNAVTDLQNGIDMSGQVTKKRGQRLAKAKAGAESALATAHTTKESDPLGAFAAVVEADTELDAALDHVHQTKASTDKGKERLDREIIAAQSQVTAASDFVSTRRGAVGSAARTRLAESQRHLSTARRLSPNEPDAAFHHAQDASGLASRASIAAQNDVARWHSDARCPKSGDVGTAGAVLGGVLVENAVRGGIRGSLDGIIKTGARFIPASFGGRM